MKFVIFFSLFALVVSHPTIEPDAINYHSKIGIAKAARIKAAEEAGVPGASRITGGTEAAPGQYPWQGGLIISLTSGYTSVCGSSLISNTKALTAAHCWSDGSQQAILFEVVLGSTTLFSGGIRLTTSDVTVHEGWNMYTISNDIAIFTVEFVPFSAFVSSISLPASANNQYVGRWAWAAGFGLQKDFVGISQNQTLHHVPLQVISLAACQGAFGSFASVDNICTQGVDNQNICSSDSGGPLALLEGTPELIGVTSFGAAGGCETGLPAGFASVAYFLDWIKARM